MSPLLLALQLVAGAADYTEEIRAAVDDVKTVYAVPPTLVRAVIRVESAGNPKAKSKCGAIGLMQVMPFNAEKLGLSSVEELWVPRLNILAGVRLLAALLKHYQGDVVAALVAYNSGPKSREVVPSNGETPAYVVRILQLWKEFESPSGASPRAK